jgi:hypothetical protein
LEEPSLTADRDRRSEEDERKNLAKPDVIGLREVEFVFELWADVAPKMKEPLSAFSPREIDEHNETAQIRKAISQLYEYCYRYERVAALWIVLSRALTEASAWMIDYLRTDRLARSSAAPRSSDQRPLRRWQRCPCGLDPRTTSRPRL